METHRWAVCGGFFWLSFGQKESQRPTCSAPSGHIPSCVPQFAVALTSSGSVSSRPSLSCGGLAR